MKFFKRDADQPPATAASRIGVIPESLVEQHGYIKAQILFEEQEALRAETVRRLNLLNAQLDAANAELEKRETALLERLPPLRVRMDKAYAVWLKACEDLEAARTGIDAELAPYREEVRLLLDKIRGPLLHNDMVKQWRIPEWSKIQK